MNENTQTFIGVKAVKATPMNRADYNTYRGWDLPANENGADEGYLVEYLDGEPNCVNHKGYVSWSPKEQFDNAHRAIPESRVQPTLHAFMSALEATATRA